MVVDTVRASRRLVVVWGAWAWTPCLRVAALVMGQRTAAARGERFRPHALDLLRRQDGSSSAALAWGPNRGRVRCSPASAECKMTLSVNSGQPQNGGARACAHQFMQIAISLCGRAEPQTRTRYRQNKSSYLPASTPNQIPPRPPPRRSRAPPAARARVVAPPRCPAAAPPRRAIVQPRPARRCSRPRRSAYKDQ